MSSPTVFIVIPCYNEASRFPALDFEKFIQSEEGAHLLFVNDGSTDETQSILDSLSAKFPQKMAVLNLDKNVGKGEAIRLGMNHLFSNAENASAFVAYLDADLSTPPSEIMRFVKICEENPELQFIAGSRVKLFGSAQIERFTHRHYLGRIIATFISETLGLAIYDTQCGAKVCKTELAKKLFSKPFISRWLFDVEIFFRLIEELGRDNIEKHVMEIPVKSWIEKGQSKIRFTDLLRIPFDLWKIKRSFKNL